MVSAGLISCQSVDDRERHSMHSTSHEKSVSAVACLLHGAIEKPLPSRLLNVLFPAFSPPNQGCRTVLLAFGRLSSLGRQADGSCRAHIYGPNTVCSWLSPGPGNAGPGNFLGRRLLPTHNNGQCLHVRWLHPVNSGPLFLWAL